MTIAAIRILGVDPGLRTTGWGVIEVAGSRLSFHGCGSIETDAAASLAERLAAIHSSLIGLVEREGPNEAAIEETFVNRDPQSTLKLGQARGATLASLALSGLPVSEYAANLIKKTVVGVGHAEKRQVAMMVRMLLPGSTAADARRRGRARGRHLPRPAPGRARARGGMIGKLSGVVDSVDEEALILDVNGVGYLVRRLRPNPAGAARGRRGGGASHRDPCARRRDQALRLPDRDRARLVSPAAKRAGGRRQSGARHSRRPLGGSAQRRR